MTIRNNTSRHYDISLTIPSGTPEKEFQGQSVVHN